MSYLTLNVLFLGLTLWFTFWVKTFTKTSWGRPFWISRGITFAVLMVFSAVFDNVIILMGLVAYDTSKLSGIFIGVAPIEDFAYTIAAVALLPSLWELMASGVTIANRRHLPQNPNDPPRPGRQNPKAW
jgi:lycopene cyclase domain-containing protein